MDNNKSFFYYTTSRGTLTTGVGVVNSEALNLRHILGQKYDKYEAFNLAVEAVHLDGGTSLDDRAVFCIHVEGFPFFNNYYDTLQIRAGSRVMEVVSQRGFDGSTSGGNAPESHLYSANFLQNLHRISFYRPATPYIQPLTVFITSSSGVRYDNTTSGFSLIFSITGLDAYRIKRIPRPLVYRSFAKENPTLVLNSQYATDIDPMSQKKRIFRFERVNWRQVIGNELFNRYSKFALTTRRISMNYADVSFTTNVVQNAPLYLSGSNLVFETKSSSQYTTSDTNAMSRHSGTPVVIGTIRGHSGFMRVLLNMVDVYIENVFYRPAEDTGSLTLHWSNFDGVALASANNSIPPNTANTLSYPTLVVQFEIIPVVDVA